MVRDVRYVLLILVVRIVNNNYHHASVEDTPETMVFLFVDEEDVYLVIIISTNRQNLEKTMSIKNRKRD